MDINFISFEEAMKASKEGKVVRFYDKEGYYDTLFNYDDPIIECKNLDHRSFKELIEGTWIVQY